LLPPFSPMLVPARVVLGDMTALGLVAAVALDLLATAAIVILAGTPTSGRSCVSARRSSCAAC
jgi:hypothetical protein